MLSYLIAMKERVTPLPPCRERPYAERAQAGIWVKMAPERRIEAQPCAKVTTGAARYSGRRS